VLTKWKVDKMNISLAITFFQLAISQTISSIYKKTWHCIHNKSLEWAQ
jgi:hypothetical protein